MRLRIATRPSPLARVQTQWVAERIRAHDSTIEIEEVLITTKGDQIQDRPLREIGGKGLFIAEIEAALIEGAADLAVHSMKDIPGDVGLARGMEILCVPKREDPRDVLLSRTGEELMDLTAGSRVGTTALRRVCQLQQRRPDLAYRTLRGNIDTRIRKLDENEYDAIVLAMAGLRRLGRLDRSHAVLPLDLCLPAVGQGALAIEGRADRGDLRTLLAPLEDAPSRITTTAERTLLLRLQGNCQVPIAGHARFRDQGGRLELSAMVASEDGSIFLSAASECYLAGAKVPELATSLGNEVADALLAQGARKLMDDAAARFAQHHKQGNGGGNKDRWKFTS